MGPYCNFCNQRCFTFMPDSTPDHIRNAYVAKVGPAAILATCHAGQRLEKEKVGYCLDDIRAWAAAHPAEAGFLSFKARRDSC